MLTAGWEQEHQGAWQEMNLVHSFILSAVVFWELSCLLEWYPVGFVKGHLTCKRLLISSSAMCDCMNFGTVMLFCGPVEKWSYFYLYKLQTPAMCDCMICSPQFSVKFLIVTHHEPIMEYSELEYKRY